MKNRLLARLKGSRYAVSVGSRYAASVGSRYAVSVGSRCAASVGSRYAASVGLGVAVFALTALPIAGQTSASGKTPASPKASSGPASPKAGEPASPKAAKAWTPPRTADGQPDLQGVWANNNATPLERPKELAGKPLLNEAEVAALKAKAAELFSGDGDAAFGDDVFTAIVTGAKEFKSSDRTTGNYNQFWIADRDFDNRTSLITEPADGRLPPLTPEAQKRRAGATLDRNQRGANGPEDRTLSERCITFGAPRLQAAYNSYIQIFQTKHSVAIVMETIHDARIIPLDGRPHVGQNLRQWLGDSVGHWEGDTLVVDTTNYSQKSDFRGAHENLHVVERFTRVSPTRIDYEIHVDDPSTWTRPWTAMIPLKLTNEEMYEYACHEGNEGMVGILQGAREQEKAALNKK